MSTGTDDKPTADATETQGATPAKKAAPRKRTSAAKASTAKKTPAKKAPAKKSAGAAKAKTAAAAAANKAETKASPAPEAEAAAPEPQAESSTASEAPEGASAEPSAKDLFGDKKWEHYLKRGVFMLVFGFLAWIAISISFLAAGVQFIILVLTGGPNELVTKLIVTLGNYIADVMAYLSFKSDELPFPLGKKLPVEE